MAHALLFSPILNLSGLGVKIADTVQSVPLGHSRSSREREAHVDSSWPIWTARDRYGADTVYAAFNYGDSHLISS